MSGIQIINAHDGQYALVPTDRATCIVVLGDGTEGTSQTISRPGIPAAELARALHVAADELAGKREEDAAPVFSSAGTIVDMGTLS